MSVLVKAAVATTIAVPLTTDTLLLSFNSQRKGAFILNSTTGNIYIKYGTGASATSNIATIATGATLSLSTLSLPVYAGQVNVFAAVAGNVTVTEW